MAAAFSLRTQSVLALCFSTLFFIVQLFLLTSCEVEVYIVYLGERQHENPDLVTASHVDMLSTLLGSEEAALQSIVYNYKHGFSGFAATLTKDQAMRIAEFPGVVYVVQNQMVEMQTTRSWDYLGLDYHHQTEIINNSKLGDDVIIGIVDSGIWPESRSFKDDGYGPVPPRWNGTCQTGEAFNTTHCNRKLIGARFYTGGVSPSLLRSDYLSPRDGNGHGTHTASIAAGSPVPGAASPDGLAFGLARGGAPRARIAVYKVLWGDMSGSFISGILAAVDDAIHDGVDVLSLSLGEGFLDVSIGYLHAVARGITVVFAAGNAGPRPQTIVNSAPWVISAAASTIDRSFPVEFALGNNQSLVGQHPVGSHRLGDGFKGLYADPVDRSCNSGTLNATMAKGKIILCFMGFFGLPYDDFQTALSTVQRAGAIGIIFALHTTHFSLSCRNVSCILVDRLIGIQILDYVGTTRSPMVKISAPTTDFGSKVLSPKVASFSSRGPTAFGPEILKPDIAAPGVNILAAINDSYGCISGTSMSTPHIAGIAALIKSVHPSWTPSAIKSALVTTASITDDHGLPITAESTPRKLADPFDYGGGHVNPTRALDPGLVYDIDAADYFKFHCHTGFVEQTPIIRICNHRNGSILDLNLPSISIPNLKSTQVVKRTVTNVGQHDDAIYKAIIEPPSRVKMVVKPSVLVFNNTTTKHTFKIKFSAALKVQGDFTFGSLTWEDGEHFVRIPIAVRVVIQEFAADVM